MFLLIFDLIGWSFLVGANGYYLGLAVAEVRSQRLAQKR